MPRFRKRPVVVEATQWFRNGDHPDDNCRKIVPVPGDGDAYMSEGKIVRRFRRPDVPGGSLCTSSIPCGSAMIEHGWIDTPEGGHTVCPGDYVITGVAGERYPCKATIFHATYEPVDAAPSTDAPRPM